MKEHLIPLPSNGVQSPERGILALENSLSPPLSEVSIQQPQDTPAKLERHSYHFGQRRGEWLVELITKRSSDTTQAKTVEKISHLDQNFSQFAANYAEVLRDDTRLIERFADQARVAQDSVIYKSLKERFFSLGKELGEAQGRVIDTERLDQANKKISELEFRIEKQLNSSALKVVSLPDELAGANAPMSGLQSALRAALRQGERVGNENRIAAETDAAHIYRNISGWKEYLPTWFPFFKPFHVVHDILRGKDKTQLGYIDEALANKLGVGLSEALTIAYGKNYTTRISWLRAGDEVAGAALSAARELGSFFSTKRSRGESIREIYESLPIQELPRFEKLLAQELEIKEGAVQDFIAGRITVRAAQKLQALRSDGMEPEARALKEQVIHLADLLESKGSRQLTARTVLREFEGESLDKFADLYRRENGQSLRSAIETRLPPSAAKDLCLAIIDGDRKRQFAAEVKCSFVYRSDWIGAPFLRISRAESEEKRAAYVEIYNPGSAGETSFWENLKQAAWKEDYFFLSKIPPLCRLLDKLTWPFTNSYPFLESIVVKGELSRAERLRYYMVGLGTDIDGIFAEFKNLTTEEVRQTEAEYQALYNHGFCTKIIEQIPLVRDFFLIGKLRHDLRVELSGDHEFDISILLEGLPSEGDELSLCETKFDHLKRRYHHERSGILLKNGLLNRWRGDGIVLKAFEEDYKAALNFYRDHIKDQPRLSPSSIKRFCTLVRLAETQADAYRDAKVTVSALVLNSGAFIGATGGAVGVLMFSSLPWWSAAAAAGIGSLCWRWAQGNLLLGRGFGKTDATFQAIRAAIDGASMFTVRIGVATLSGLVGRQLSSGVAKGGFKTSLNKFIQSLENKIKRQDKARHLIERGSVIASEDELTNLSEGFFETIENDSEAIGSEKITGGNRIEDVFIRALLEEKRSASSH